MPLAGFNVTSYLPHGRRATSVRTEHQTATDRQAHMLLLHRMFLVALPRSPLY